MITEGGASNPSVVSSILLTSLSLFIIFSFLGASLILLLSLFECLFVRIISVFDYLIFVVFECLSGLSKIFPIGFFTLFPNGVEVFTYFIPQLESSFLSSFAFS